MPIKLTLFFTYEVSLDQWARIGLLKRELRIYEELIKKYDVQVQLLTYGNESDYQWLDDMDGITALPIYSKMRYHQSKTLRLLQTVLIPWKFRSELASQDIFKTNQMFGGWVAVISKIFFKKPLIVRCGYEVYDAYKFQRKSYKLIWSIWLMSWFTYKSSDAVHVATSKDANVVNNSFGVPLSKIEIRPNWIDVNIFKPTTNNNRFTDRVLFVGRIEKQKNIFLLLDALCKTEIAVDIVGEGSLKSSLREYAKNIGVQVNFLGAISNNEMPQIYNSYAAYVLCSLYEGNPKTLLEAMACGCSVIGTDVQGIRSVISHKKNGLLVDENPSSLRLAILEVLSNNRLRKVLAGNSIKYIENNNSLQKSLPKEFYAYKNCLK